MEPKEYDKRNNRINTKPHFIYIYIYIYILIILDNLLLRLPLHFTTLVDTSLLPI